MKHIYFPVFEFRFIVLFFNRYMLFFIRLFTAK